MLLPEHGCTEHGGPCPPPGKPHRYHFKLYALDTTLHLKPRATKRQVSEAWKDMTIPAGTQSGTVLQLTGKGMPKVGEKGKGDLFVVVEVRTPTDLSDRERVLLQELERLRPST